LNCLYLFLKFSVLIYYFPMVMLVLFTVY